MRNYKSKHTLAEEYFIEQGMMPPKDLRTEKWILHHKDPSWKHEDPERYKQWNVEDLVPMTESEHIAWHNTHTKDYTDETFLAKERETHTGKKYSDEVNKSKGRSGELNGAYGRKHTDEERERMRGPRPNGNYAKSDEHKKKISEANKGKPKSPEHIKKMSERNKGKHWWHTSDGRKCCARECPGPEWLPGMK